ncbi:MAG: 4-(cytidine 5'-diphospho)-2-C-methyl-D-erythritol kinase, partial [Chlamydiia bacterium]|nr:4-(cytidine 5'-diphospho)-2-C-methyl-D-erythritol kinase [Chlamydiia bacterium]
TKVLALYSPAKVNLFLRILKRRPDGYHDLASVLQTIDLMDGITLRIDHPDFYDSFSCSDVSLPMDGANLVQRALELFRARSQRAFSAQIHLEKRIPVQAGLGGGSGNAATVLWGLNRLHGDPIPWRLPLEWAAELGSDVPFFLSHGTALAEGRGECLRDLPEIAPGRPVTIVKPEQGLCTAHVYAALELSRCAAVSTADCLDRIQRGEGAGGINDLERAAFRVFPELEDVKTELLACGFQHVLLSGSGSAFFCLGDAEDPCIDGCEVFQARFVQRTAMDWYRPSEVNLHALV